MGKGQKQSTIEGYKTGPTCLGDMHVSMSEVYSQSAVTKTDHFFQEASPRAATIYLLAVLGRSWAGDFST